MAIPIIKVVLIDDHALVRDGIRSLLEESQDIEVVGEAADGRQGLEVIRETQPDIAIVDIRMPGMSGIETMKEIPGYSDKTRGLILSMHDSEEYVLNSIQAGASGYLLKDISSDEFVKAIQTVHKGEQYFSGDVSGILAKKYLESLQGATRVKTVEHAAPETDGISLTRRERQILDLVAQGMSSKDIAADLEKSVRTIEAHRFNLMKKMQVHNQMELINKARELGLL